MPNLFRTLDGTVRKPSTPISFERADGTAVEAIWASSAQEEKLDWWLRDPGSQLVQSEEVIAIAVKAKDTQELLWADAPPGARLIFLLQPPPPGKNYQLAKMVTTASTPAQIATFRHDRFSLFGTLNCNGTISKIPPLDPPPPAPKAQGELF
jgi:hypothetical protein